MGWSAGLIVLRKTPCRVVLQDLFVSVEFTVLMIGRESKKVSVRMTLQRSHVRTVTEDPDKLENGQLGDYIVSVCLLALARCEVMNTSSTVTLVWWLRLVLI